MSKTDTRFVSTTKKVISEFQQATRNVNTDKSRTVWMFLFTKFHELRNYSNEIIELDNKTLLDQLEQFIVEIRKLNGQETLDGYMKSLVNDSDKNRKQSRPLEIDEIKGGDAKQLKASWLKELDDSSMRLELPKEKNYASICKDAKLDFKDCCITNHSMRSTGIHNLVELGITLDKQIIFSRHKSIAEVSAYQHQSLKCMRDNVSLLIPVKSA
ncbi:24810_t:CDS:2, partial [Gigaspora margarita]